MEFCYNYPYMQYDQKFKYFNNPCMPYCQNIQSFKYPCIPYGQNIQSFKYPYMPYGQNIQSFKHPYYNQNSIPQIASREPNVQYSKSSKYSRLKKMLPVFIFTILAAIPVIVGLSLLNNKEYTAILNGDSQYNVDISSFCYAVSYSHFNAISTPIAAFLIIIFIILYQRRVFLRDRCSFSFIGLPMIISCWSKKNRFVFGMVYARISYEVFRIFFNLFYGDGEKVPEDPTGIARLLTRVTIVILIGLRYYPVLVAFRVDKPLIYLLTTIYAWIDFGSTFYIISVCESTLIVEDLIKYGVDGFRDCCSRFSKPNDKNEIIFSEAEIYYVIELFKRKNDDERKAEPKPTTTSSNPYDGLSYYGLNQESEEPKKGFLSRIGETVTKLLSFIYIWDKRFKFSARFVSSYIVALLALYYFFIFFSFLMYVYFISPFVNLPDNNLVQNSLNLGDLLCSFGQDFCLEQLKTVNLDLPISNNEITFDLRSSVIASFSAPLFIALLTSLLQVYLSVRDTKKHLQQLYKGNCDFVPKKTEVSNASAASGSFKYGGYVVGYLVWGYVIQYFFIVIVALVITFMRFFIGTNIFKNLALKIIPVVCGFVVKKIITSVSSRYIFLNRRTKILSLDNIRAFNIFLYFNFFFDCFMGTISAFLRVIRSTVINIFWMPRISYSFMGRQWERSDNGYGTYIGYLYMEAAHTNPIVVSFCSLTYYKGLNEHVRQRVLEKTDAKPINPYTRFNNQYGYTRPFYRKQYRKHIVNRWHVMLMLIKNPVLVLERK